MKKIIHIITKSKFGGAQRYLYDIVTKLPKDEFDVAVAVGNEGELTDMLRGAGIKVHLIDSLSRDIKVTDELKAFRSMLKLLKDEKPDIIHLHSSKAGAWGALAGRIAGVPRVIFTAHGWAFNERRSLPAKVFFWGSHWFTVFCSHKTICVSDYMARQARSFPFSRKKILVIKNSAAAIDFMEKGKARQLLAEKLKRDANFFDNKKIVGTISELHDNKGIDTVIDAMALLPTDMVYVVMGEGEKRKQLENQIAALKLEDRVFLLGHIADGGRYLKAYDVYVQASRTEALGYVLLEAGLAELPVAATDVGGLPEIIEDGKNGILMKDRETKTFVEAVRRLFGDKEFAAMVALSLRKKVETEFSFENMLSKTVALYK